MASTFDHEHPRTHIVDTEEKIVQQAFAYAYDEKSKPDEKTPISEKHRSSSDVEVVDIGYDGDDGDVIRQSGIFRTGSGFSDGWTSFLKKYGHSDWG